MWLVMALTGCVVGSSVVDGTAPDGTIDLTWGVGSSGCEEAGVTDIVVTAGDVEGQFACADGAAKLDVPPGTYALEARGLDVGGVDRYSGTTTVTVSSETSTAAHVVLSALPGGLRVTWFFENGRLCASNGVTDIRATLFDDEDYVVDEVDASCEDGAVAFEDLEAGAYAAVVVGHDGSFVPKFQGEVDAVLEKGDQVEIEVQLGER